MRANGAARSRVGRMRGGADAVDETAIPHESPVCRVRRGGRRFPRRSAPLKLSGIDVPRMAEVTQRASAIGW